MTKVCGTRTRDASSFSNQKGRPDHEQERLLRPPGSGVVGAAAAGGAIGVIGEMGTTAWMGRQGGVWEKNNDRVNYDNETTLIHEHAVTHV